MIPSPFMRTNHSKTTAFVLLTQPISNDKSACGKASRVRHMVPGGSRESLPKSKVRFADHPGVGKTGAASVHATLRSHSVFADL